jgi:hypothetical protein
MATMADGSWQIDIGDPTPLGWITVAAYTLAAVASWRCHGAIGARLATRFWMLLTLTMAALGINKQLDLQTALTHVARTAAHAQGWYERRQPLQVVVVALFAIGGVAALGVLLRLARPLSPGRTLALCGGVFLAAFVLIRLTSLEHVDLFLASTVVSLSMNGVLELGGIACVFLGAVLELRAAPGAPWAAPQ